jgi:hypothetical protein
MSRKTLRLIFDEATTVANGTNPYWMDAVRYKIDGTNNIISWSPSIQVHEQDSVDTPFVFPAYPYDSNLIEAVKKYFDIFDVTVISAPASFFEAAVANQGSDEYIIKLFPIYAPGSAEFNNLPVKYNNFKRYLRWLYRDDKNSTASLWVPLFSNGKPWPRRVGEAHVTRNYGTVNDNNKDTGNISIAGDIAHEFGHMFGLKHWGDNRAASDIKNRDGSYYGDADYHNKDWSPVMGIQKNTLCFAQWANSDSYLQPFCTRLQDDVADIHLTASLIKKPSELSKKTKNNNWRLDFKDRAHKKQAIFYTISAGNPLYGLLGYPYDYDVVKILFKKGSYKVKASPYNSMNRMTDCEITHLKCKCEKDKVKNNVDMSSDFGDTYESPGQNLSFQKILVGNDEAEKDLIFDYAAKGGNMESASTPDLPIDTSYTTLVYLKIRGDNGLPVDDDDNPTAVDKSWSRYGALGQYQLQIDTGGVLDPGSDIPGGHCEEFIYCSNGVTKKINLFVQDEKDSGSGDPNKLHVLENSAVINGEVVEKKFLVYGQPIAINAPEEPGKFYLPVLINGECKKQEFVVGLP